MPDFTWPEVRLHSVNIREQFVAPLMDGRLKAITRLNGRGYNAGDFIRFSVLPMQSSDVQFSMTTQGERETLQNRFYEMLVREKKKMDALRFEIDRTRKAEQKFTDPLDAYAELFDTAYPQGYNSQYTKRHTEPSLDSIAKVATEAASGAERPRSL